MTATCEEFKAAFQGLAKHLFPDGCPDPNLESVWPSYDRTPAPRTDAMNSYDEVVHLPGLSSLQMHAMIVTTLSLLPQSKYKGPLATTTYFDKTLQAIIPSETIPTCAVERLLSGVTARAAGRCTVLQFLYLSVAYGCVELDYVEKRYYSFLMHWSMQAETCHDAVRLLLLLSPQPRYLRRLLGPPKPGLASLSLLLQHYTTGVDQRLAFPNREWEQSFQRFHRRRVPFISQHSWKELSLVAGGPSTTAHSRSVWMERWFHGNEVVQRELLEQLAPPMDDFCVQRLLPLWDGKDPELWMRALPLQVTVLPYLERHFLFGSSAVQLAIGDYLLRFVEQDAKVVFVFAHDLLLRTLMMNFSAVVAFIAFDVLECCSCCTPDPALVYLLGLSGVSWERFHKLITRYKNEHGMDHLDAIVDNLRQVLSGGPRLEHLCHQSSVQQRLHHIIIRMTRKSNLDDLQTGTSELVEAIQIDWPEAFQFLDNSIL